LANIFFICGGLLTFFIVSFEAQKGFNPEEVSILNVLLYARYYH
jgi:hypothetical protein